MRNLGLKQSEGLSVQALPDLTLLLISVTFEVSQKRFQHYRFTESNLVKVSMSEGLAGNLYIIQIFLIGQKFGEICASSSNQE